MAAIEEEVQAANIEENDHTVFTYQDLDFELRLFQQTVVKKIKFIDNQVRIFAFSHENAQLVRLYINIFLLLFHRSSHVICRI